MTAQSRCPAILMSRVAAITTCCRESRIHRYYKRRGPKSMNADKRVVVITGGAQGIGRRTSELLAERGYNVAIIDLREPTATMKAIESAGSEVLGYAGDIASEATVSEFAQH